MKLIGLTGGIGSGKSTVAAMFKILAIPVYESDSKAKLLMESDETLKKQIRDLLGSNAYTEGGYLNRSWIASQVFADRKKLEELNAIVHPAVYKDLVTWGSLEDQLKAPYLIQESAIFFEEDLTSRVEAIILVVADQETRIARVMARDNLERSQVMKRIEHQWPDEKKIPLADYVIFNDQNRKLIQQVTDIHEMILALSTSVRILRSRFL